MPPRARPGAARRPASRSAATRSRWRFAPATAERWPDLEALFGERGACAGCWCMWFRLPKRTWDAQKGDANREALRAIVEEGPPPGILAYVTGRGAAGAAGGAVGWCAVAPREAYPRLAGSRVMKPVDDQPVWSVTCLFIDRGHRGQGLSVALLEAAAAFAKQQGARIIEGYAVEPASGRLPATFAYQGPASAYRSAGFTEVARRSLTRPIMRRTLT